jgi:penicillin G amidase
MVALIVASLALLTSPATTTRDAYGVPHVVASTWEDAFFEAGRAVAEDRLWQLENSRRVARGKMAEVYGAKYVASDREVLATGYTQDELRQQFMKLSPRARSAYESYARGINAHIARMKDQAALPPGYKEIGFEPEPWDVLDSVAITIRLWHLFGRGGAGELRNMALLAYLQAQPATKERALDVFDDFLWQRADDSVPTVMPQDDPLLNRPPQIADVTRQITERHIEMLPKVSLFELLPGLRIAQFEESTRVARLHSVPWKTGSYAVVVGPERSATGAPFLLSAPQMGFQDPSIVHEMSITAPGLNVSGMNVPGIPGVLIGYTPTHAWGITSGVADIEDIFFYRMDGEEGYLVGSQRHLVEVITHTLRVRGEADQVVEQRRTIHGPIVVTSKSGGAYFARRSPYRMNEMRAYEALLQMYDMKGHEDVFAAAREALMTFNFFYATTAGRFGYHFMGHVPLRAESIDPRLPTPAEPKFDWRGMVPPDQMPHVISPKSGLIANWNNKPSAWWPNLDTPVWGEIFRNELLLRALDKPKLGRFDLEFAAWKIARGDETVPYFLPLFVKALDGATLNPLEADAANYLSNFDGWMVQGSVGAAIYSALVEALKEEVFVPRIGTLISLDNLRMAAQPSLLLRALERRTNFDYLGDRQQGEVTLSAFRKVVAGLADRRGANPALWTFEPGAIRFPGEPPTPYGNRGTYIQIIELRDQPVGRNVLPPGVAETGPHARDQAPLARGWLYKPMSLGLPRAP